MITSTEGFQIAIYDLGGTGEVPVVLAHGTGLHGLVWRPLVEAFAIEGPEFRCYSFDARGHGDTGVPPDRDFDWRALSQDIRAVLEALGVVRPYGVGHSSGATALLLAEELQPGTFEKLYCFEPIIVPADPPLGRDPDNWLAAQARNRREVFRDREEAYTYYSTKPAFARVTPAVLRAYVEHGFSDTDDGAVRLKCRRENEALMYEMATNNECFGQLAQVACPVMLASGEGSEVVQDGLLKALVQRLAKPQLATLTGVGHLGPLEAPAAVARSALRFFRTSEVSST